MSEWLPWLLPNPVQLLVVLLGLLLWRATRPRRTRAHTHRATTFALLAATLWTWIGSTPALADLALRRLEGAQRSDPDPGARQR
jgi:hypothetical protein